MVNLTAVGSAGLVADDVDSGVLGAEAERASGEVGVPLDHVIGVEQVHAWGIAEAVDQNAVGGSRRRRRSPRPSSMGSSIT